MKEPCATQKVRAMLDWLESINNQVLILEEQLVDLKNCLELESEMPLKKGKSRKK